MKADRIAILGGSFDPIHLGHLFLLHCAVSMTDYRSFLLIPAKVSNFKQDRRPTASDRHRLRMLDLAIEDYRDLYPQDLDADIRVSTLELDRGGVSYTSDTVRALRGLHPEAQLALIMGDDHIGGLSRWHEFPYIRDNVEFLICRRSEEGTPWDLLPQDIRCRRLEPSEVAPQSSSAIRTDLEGNLDYLSKRVRDYVKANGLYD